MSENIDSKYIYFVIEKCFAMFMVLLLSIDVKGVLH